jgi:hypothetical protein
MGSTRRVQPGEEAGGLPAVETGETAELAGLGETVELAGSDDPGADFPVHCTSLDGSTGFEADCAERAGAGVAEAVAGLGERLGDRTETGTAGGFAESSSPHEAGSAHETGSCAVAEQLESLVPTKEPGIEEPGTGLAGKWIELAER